MSTRLLGPPRLFWIASAIIALVTLVDLAVFLSEYRFLFAALAGVVIWRIMRIGVFLDGDRVVVRNMYKTLGFRVGEIDIAPLTPDRDDTPNGPKRYVLTQGAKSHSIDALSGRAPADHERTALELRRAIIEAASDEVA